MPGKREQITNIHDLEIEARRRKVTDAILAGKTYRQIAGELNVSLGTVAGDKKAVVHAWQKEQKADIADWTAIQMARLGELLVGLWSKAKAGDGPAIDRAMRIMERMDYLMGVDAAQSAPAQSLTIQWVDALAEDEVIGVGADELASGTA
ncbi:MAG: hypothetical protein OHK0046_46490 [Anaerolineae bacterium]